MGGRRSVRGLLNDPVGPLYYISERVIWIWVGSADLISLRDVDNVVIRGVSCVVHDIFERRLSPVNSHGFASDGPPHEVLAIDNHGLEGDWKV